jgi:hypothetical protein
MDALFGDVAQGGSVVETADGRVMYATSPGAPLLPLGNSMVVCPVLGINDIAQLLRVQPDTVHKWRKRDLLPAPPWSVNGLPAWPREQVIRWAIERTGTSPARRGPRPASVSGSVVPRLASA